MLFRSGRILSVEHVINGLSDGLLSLTGRWAVTDDALVFELSDVDPEETIEDSKNFQLLIGEIMEQREKINQGESEQIEVTCPWCRGTGKEGHDRCMPPNPYVCEVCGGYGKVLLSKIDSKEDG